MQYLPCVWMDRGQRCGELSLAARGSARVFRSRRFTERTAWLHRWQIIERVEKSEECSPARNSLLKNVHHAPSLPTFQRIQSPGRKCVFPACLPFVLGNILSMKHMLYIWHFLNQPQLRLRPQPCKCANGNYSSTIDLLLSFSFYALPARLGPLGL